MKKLVSSFRRFLTEAANALPYDENLFEVIVELVISKSSGGDKTQTFSELRSVDNITIIKQVPHTSSEDDLFYYADVVVRFIPLNNETALSSLGVLLDQARQVKGVEKIEPKVAATKISTRH